MVFERATMDIRASVSCWKGLSNYTWLQYAEKGWGSTGNFDPTHCDLICYTSFIGVDLNNTIIS